MRGATSLKTKREVSGSGRPGSSANQALAQLRTVEVDGTVYGKVEKGDIGARPRAIKKTIEEFSHMLVIRLKKTGELVRRLETIMT